MQESDKVMRRITYKEEDAEGCGSRSLEDDVLVLRSQQVARALGAVVDLAALFRRWAFKRFDAV